MPPSDDRTDETFYSLILRLRGRTGLTQRKLAARVGVSISSIQGWEAGNNYPGVASLRALIVVGLEAGGFTPGHERREAQALWSAALRDAPRFRTPFDGTWFEQIAVGQHEPVQDEATSIVTALPAPPTTISGARRESWGEAPDVANFVGRVGERALLSQWILDERSRVVAVLGLGGIGKSLLATRVARDLAPSFEYVFWRSLRDAPTPGEWLSAVLRFLAPEVAPESGGEPALFRRLLELLGETRCLLVLDNVETVLQPGGPVGAYRAGYERYAVLLRQVAEAPHRSCLVLTSREEPAELGPLLGARGPVRALELAGFGTEDGRALLDDKRLHGDDDAWRALVDRYGGNGLALKLVGETTRELFDGSIADYLEFATGTPGVMVGGLRQLLRDQVQRLSELEHALLRRLAVAREPVSLAELATDFGPRTGPVAVLEAVEGLRRRSLLERSERGRLFGLHSVVLEYVTDELLEDVARELEIGDLACLMRQPLLKATAKDYVRRSQERLIAGPILARLVEARGGARAAEQRLISLLTTQRGQQRNEQGYGPGNVVNLLRLLRGDLNGVDLSGLAIRQAYLQEVEAHGASLAGAHLSEAVLGEAFSYPTSLALSEDGHNLAAGTARGEVCWWRIADRTLLVTLRGHSGAIWGAALSGDGRLVASSGFDGTVRLWDAESGRSLTTLRGHTGGVRGVALDADGSLVVSGGVDGTVRLWAAASGLALATLHGHTSEVYSVALSRDGRLAASGSHDGTVRLWDTERRRLLTILQGHTSGVLAVALSRDGQLVATGGFDGVVRLWVAESGVLRATFQGHTGGVRVVAVGGKGRLIASGGVDGTVRLWEAESGMALAALQGHASGVLAVSLSGDDRLVASGGFDGTVRLWDAESGLPLASLHGHTSEIYSVALSGDGQRVASGSFDGAVRVWEATTRRLLVDARGHVGLVYGVALSGDGRLIASGGIDGTVRVWEAGDGRPRATLRGHAGGVRGVALSGDGRLVVSGGFDGTVRLWDAESGLSLAVLSGHAGGVWGVALSADGRLVASASNDGAVRLWDPEGSRLLALLNGHTGGVWSVALSGDPHLVASAGFDGTVRLWDAASGRPIATCHGHAGLVYGVALSGDGRLVASGGVDGTVRLWSSESSQPLATLGGHAGLVHGVALSEDGQMVASGGVDGTVRLWAASTGACLGILRDDRRYERVDITGLTGVTEAQRETLFALGAVERSGQTAPSA